MDQSQLTAELNIRFTPHWETGDITADLVMDPAGAIAMVTGFPKLVQHITRFLLTRQGALLGDPDYGNPALDRIGTPGISAEEMGRQMLDAAETWYRKQPEQHPEEALGGLALVGASYEPNRQAPRYLKLTFTIASRAGSAEQMALPFKARTGPGIEADVAAIDDEPIEEEEEEAEQVD